MVCISDRLCSLYNEAQRLKNFMRYKSYLSMNMKSNQMLEAEDAGSSTIEEKGEEFDVLETNAFELFAIDEDKLVDSISDLLDREIQNNEASNKTISCDSIKVFHSSPRSFTASYYVRRMMRYSGASTSCLVVALIYLDRLQDRVPTLRLTSTTIQRLLLVVVMEATKFLEDVPRTNTTW
jgi:hypothetical protein